MNHSVASIRENCIVTVMAPFKGIKFKKHFFKKNFSSQCCKENKSVVHYVPLCGQRPNR